MKAKTLAIAAQKGGVGKTTTAVNLAVAFSRFWARKTLLVDLDGQGHIGLCMSRYLLGGETKALSDCLLSHKSDCLEIAMPTRIEGLYVTPSDKGLSHAEGILATKIGREFSLKHALKRASEYYDCIVIDCPPNIGNLTLCGLVASDACIVPCELEPLSIDGISDILAVLDTIEDRLGHRCELVGILPTRVDKRNPRLTSAMLEKLHMTYQEKVLPVHIPVNSALAKSQMQGLSVFDYEFLSTGAKAYQELASLVLERLENLVLKG
jgi:chromosome partitioning protein